VRHSEETKAMAKKLRECGMSYAKIGEALGVPESTVTNWLSEKCEEYRQSEKHKEYQKKYRQSEKYKESQRKYLQSEKYKETRRKYQKKYLGMDIQMQPRLKIKGGI
jgi:predicted transcriptional regulator